MRRKIILPAFFYISGILIFINQEDTCSFTYIAGVCLIILFSMWGLNKYYDFSLKQILLLFICICIGIGNSTIYLLMNQNPFENLYGQSHHIVMKTNHLIFKDDYIQAEGSIKEIDGQKFECRGKVLIYVYSDSLSEGYISGNCELKRPDSRRNPHCFDYRNYLLSKGIVCTGIMKKVEYVKGEDSIKSRLNLLKKRFLDTISKTSSEENIALIKGICFGDKSDIDEESMRWFRENGTAHVLAVSGLHIGVIYALIKRLLYKRNRVLFYIILIMILAAYGTLTEWSVSVVRATMIILVSVMAFLLERRFDMTSGTVAVAIVILIKNPFEIMGAGFQMSFLAVLSLAFFSEPIKSVLFKFIIKQEKYVDTLAPIISIQLGLGLFTAYTFNYFPFIGCIVNIPTVFIVSYMVPLVLVQFGIFGVFGVLPLGKLSDITASALNWINRICYCDGTFSATMLSSKSVLVAFVIIMIFYLSSESFRIDYIRRNKRKIVFTVIMALLASASLFVDKDAGFNKADLIFVDVGQGDCLHIRSNDENYLIDGGGKLEKDIGLTLLKPYLLKNQARKIDGAFATHNHTDHYLGLCQLSKEVKIKKAFVSRGYIDVSNGVKNNLRAKEHYFIDDSNLLEFGKNLKVEVLWPEPGSRLTDDRDENQVSLVFMVNLRGIKTLVTGDIDEQCEKALLEKYKGSGKLKCDILKVAHHGSKYSSSEEFIQECQPQYAVVSVGKNIYGHPSPVTISRLKAQGITVYRTDECGAIGFEIRKGEIKKVRGMIK